MLCITENEWAVAYVKHISLPDTTNACSACPQDVPRMRVFLHELLLQLCAAGRAQYCLADSSACLLQQVQQLKMMRKGNLLMLRPAMLKRKMEQPWTLTKTLFRVGCLGCLTHRASLLTFTAQPDAKLLLLHECGASWHHQSLCWHKLVLSYALLCKPCGHGSKLALSISPLKWHKVVLLVSSGQGLLLS